MRGRTDGVVVYFCLYYSNMCEWLSSSAVIMCLRLYLISESMYEITTMVYKIGHDIQAAVGSRETLGTCNRKRVAVERLVSWRDSIVHIISHTRFEMHEQP